MRNGLALLLVLAGGAWGQVPDVVKAEVNLEKRYWAALDAGQKALEEARAAMSAGEAAELLAKSRQAADCVEYAMESLEAMGKHPSQNGKNYKRAELRTRDLLRRIDTLAKDVGIDEREAVQTAQKRIGAVHEKLIDGVMSRRP
jgi:hypothetical protein